VGGGEGARWEKGGGLVEGGLAVEGLEVAEKVGAWRREGGEEVGGEAWGHGWVVLVGKGCGSWEGVGVLGFALVGMVGAWGYCGR